MTTKPDDIVEQAERYLADPASGRNVIAHDLIRFLVAEVRRLRALTRKESSPCTTPESHSDA